MNGQPILNFLEGREIEPEGLLALTDLKTKTTHVGAVPSIIIVLAWTKDPQLMFTLEFPNRLKVEICSTFGMEMDVRAGRP